VDYKAFVKNLKNVISGTSTPLQSILSSELTGLVNKTGAKAIINWFSRFNSIFNVYKK